MSGDRTRHFIPIAAGRHAVKHDDGHPVVGPSAAPPGSSTPTAGANAWRLVALGDSDTTGSGAPTGKGWVDDYAELIRLGQGREVSVSNLAQNGMSSGQLAGDVRSVKSVRDAIAAGDIVVVGMEAPISMPATRLGSRDLQGHVVLCAADRCLQDQYRCRRCGNHEHPSRKADGPSSDHATERPHRRGGRDPTVRALDRDRSRRVHGRGLRDAICTAMTSHSGQCIDVLTAFNGPGGDGDAYKMGLMNKVDCCYPSEKGQKLMADLLYATRLAPLVNP